jgi:antitoxin VapB
VTGIAKLFLSNHSQAVRGPAHLGLPDSVKAVEVRACGRERILSPIGQRWDTFFHDTPGVPDDFMAERSSQDQPSREPF